MKQPQPLMEISVRFPLHAWDGLLKNAEMLAQLISQCETCTELRELFASADNAMCRDIMDRAAGIQASLRVIQGADLVAGVRGSAK